MFRVIIPASGRGERVGASIPKQYLPLKGIPLFIHTLRVFERHPLCEGIILVLREEFFSYAKEQIESFGLRKVLSLVKGGSFRQESVYNGVLACSSWKGILLVHDVVRPFVSEELITKVYEAARLFGVALPAIPVRDALIRGDGETLFEPLNREGLYQVQTPQGAKIDLLREALERAKEDGLIFPDEGSLLYHYGYKVKIVSGSFINFKITYPEDFLLAERLISE